MAVPEKARFLLDGRPIETTTDKTVLQAALDAGVYIPHLCYSPILEPYGGCRLCLVDVEGMRDPVTSCTTLVRDGMVVRSETERINDLRRTVAALLISEHCGDCLTCRANQRCELQKVASHVGLAATSVKRMERESIVDKSSPFFVRDLAKCVLCGLCVRVCHEVRGVGAIEILNRGFNSVVAPFEGEAIAESTCEFCGACVDICPVGALWATNEILPPTDEVRTVCPYCGVGCVLVLGTRAGRLVSARGDVSTHNQGQLCVKGRFGWEFVHSPDRLTTPLIREN
ncbi:MAG: 2Fe-2S iron-sulfur cluster-binding protein, partial [Dehalococcoidia bacterium]|nr:2Fe-2S iron-sulfur cluster-binding protein [Dehalococcoidia bacterium]